MLKFRFIIILIRNLKLIFVFLNNIIQFKVEINLF